MIDANQLPFLIKLIDDESETVRENVIKELAGFGPLLEDELRRLPNPPSESRIQFVKCVVEDYKDKLKNGLNLIEEPDPLKQENIFTPGQLVKHKRYGYRGVVVHYDLSCLADEEWYRSNLTRPDRDQPWYHVLVHLSNQVTYAAQTSLLPDDSKSEIIHPFLKYFFVSFENGVYNRNSRPWEQE